MKIPEHEIEKLEINLKEYIRKLLRNRGELDILDWELNLFNQGLSLEEQLKVTSKIEKKYVSTSRSENLLGKIGYMNIREIMFHVGKFYTYKPKTMKYYGDLLFEFIGGINLN